MSFPASEFGFVLALMDHDQTSPQVFCAPAETCWVWSESVLGVMREPLASGVIALSASVPQQTPQAEELPALQSSITFPTLVALGVRLQV